MRGKELGLVSRELGLKAQIGELTMANELLDAKIDKWVRGFQAVKELRLTLLELDDRHNLTWLIERDGFISPSEARSRLLQEVAA